MSRLLDADDLPDGYAVSPPDASPEVTAATRSDQPECAALFDEFGAGGSLTGTPTASVRFEKSSAGPFVSEELGHVTSLDPLRALVGRCAQFTESDPDSGTTTIKVAVVASFPHHGDEAIAFSMAASGGQGDDAFTIGGYVVAIRVGAVACTVGHFGQPDVDVAETEDIVRTAAQRLTRK